MLTEQGTTQVIKKMRAPSATLLYYRKNEKRRTQLQYVDNTRAGTFLVELPDHSKVWLNNESSLRYPTHFDGQDTRTVN